MVLDGFTVIQFGRNDGINFVLASRTLVRAQELFLVGLARWYKPTRFLIVTLSRLQL